MRNVDRRRGVSGALLAPRRVAPHPFRQELLYGWWQHEGGGRGDWRVALFILDVYRIKADNGEIGAEGHVNR